MARNYVMASAVRSSRFKTEQLGLWDRLFIPAGERVCPTFRLTYADEIRDVHMEMTATRVDDDVSFHCRGGPAVRDRGHGN